MVTRPVFCDIYQTAIPMRSFEHAAASREMAEAVVVRVQFDDGTEGWGETLPRQYVTGETIDTVRRDLAELLWPACRGMSFDAETLCRAEAFDVPAPNARCINAALCAIDCALLWPMFRAARLPTGGGQARIDARVTGVLGSADSGRTAGRLRLMRWHGLRDFKLKLGLGDDVDAENLRLVHKRIGRAVARGKCTLRVDVNGGWSADETPQRVADLEQFGVCVVEQPAYCSAPELVELSRRCGLPLMADESLLTADDAGALLAAGRKVWWNIRISKNGGILRSKVLADMAAKHDVPFAIGCMVGESGILSAAQRALLALAPRPRFVEGNYGRFLLADDLTMPSLRFGYGGRLKTYGRSEVGIDRRKLARYGKLVATLGA